MLNFIDRVWRYCSSLATPTVQKSTGSDVFTLVFYVYSKDLYYLGCKHINANLFHYFLLFITNFSTILLLFFFYYYYFLTPQVV